MIPSPRKFVLLAAFLTAQAFAQRPVPVVPSQDAHQTRDEFVRVLEGYPPSVRAVLALDPALLSNKEYLEPYPGLGTYLAAHPEIVRDPVFYVGVIGRDIRLPNLQRGSDNWDRLAGDIGG